ncbi:ferredoxin [Galbitalea soli]|uniref:Ferredoxin n=1 Tax=Galbitalea soli TaxID=1268042 RepID=A0A7C9PKG6_9MICO|nr:ferredoxin [Galbitalea soli]NEM89785.1 ferredoxin [Galbitalea soli]NYJ30488.1 ferredoxin [Galbitalea soli]
MSGQTRLTTGARAAATHTLHIDWTACDGRGLCTELLAGLLDRDEWGYPRALGYGSDVPVSAAEEEAAWDAVALCPRQALSLRAAPRG